MSDLVFNFTSTELLAFLGLVQSVYVLVYIIFRTRKISFALIPFCFFLLLGTAFLAVIAQKYWVMPAAIYGGISWFIWSLCAPFSFLLVIQIARISRPPPFIFLPIIFIVPLSYYVSSLIHLHYQIQLNDVLSVSAIIVGAISLLMIWLKRNELDRLHKRQNGKERFWLIISIILLNIGLLSLNLAFMDVNKIELIRTFIGLGFIYVTSTSLFRVYPPAIARKNSSKDKEGQRSELSSEEINLALKIENLLHIEKVYQEPSYNRAAMSKELNVSEAQLSKIVNTYFKKNVPLLLNELRVEEAKALLKQTKEDISLIAEESGFNSIATFNRVIKDLVGVSPNLYRQGKK